MAVDLDRTKAALHVERLTKVYGDGTRALDALSLQVPAGLFFGLLRPNGAGKTTLIGAIAGLVRIRRGHAHVFGHDVGAELEARLLVGVAPQEVHLVRFLTAKEVLVYHARYFGMPRLEATQRADELLDVFDLQAKAKTKPNRLSGGMRRRLLIARARPRAAPLDPRRADGRGRSRAALRALALPATVAWRGTHRPADDALHRGGGSALRARRLHPQRANRRGGHAARARRPPRRRPPRRCLRGGDAVTVAELTVRQRRGTIALAGREVRRVLTLWTQTILPPIVTAGLLLVVFGGALGARIREIEGLEYLDFILPGLLVMTVASQSIANASTSLFQAKNEGYIEDVLTAPLRAWQLAVAYMAGGSCARS